MKIYTKTGDKGQTSLIGGTRVLKSNIRIEAYGTVDELNSWLGFLKDKMKAAQLADEILRIQNYLFTIGSQLAADPVKSKMKLPELTGNEIVWLEQEIDKMNEELPEMRFFVLPGGHELISACHIARCVCRRAERHIIALQEHENIPDHIVPYINRLSDYLFTLSRYTGFKLNIEEIPWIPEK